MKKNILGITIGIAVFSLFTFRTFASVLVGPMCYVIGEIEEITPESIYVKIDSIESVGQRGCPVEEDDVYSVSYIVADEEENNFDTGDRLRAGVEAFSSVTPNGEATSRLQWSATTFEDGSSANMVLDQSSSEPFENSNGNANNENDQEEAEETIIDDFTRKSSNMYFDLILEQKPQTPFGNYIPYILTITPHIDSARTQILWNMPTTLEARPRHDDFVSLQKGETYTFRGRVKPLRGGTYDFSISVISWQHDTNFTNTISDTVRINRNLVLEPVSSQYQILNILRYVGFILLFVGISILAVKLVKKYMQKAKKWLTPPT